MTARLIDWIWNVRGSLPLDPGQSGPEALSRLDPLFHTPGTSYRGANDTLTFSKKDPEAQDKMSVFDRGVLWVEQGAGGGVLNYHLVSRALLLCFLAPLLFLAFAQLTIIVGALEPAPSPVKVEQKSVVSVQNPIDKALGAPAPEKKEVKKDKKLSPTSAYVFAAIFAALYLIGRILEGKLVKALFKRQLRDATRSLS